MSIIPGALKVSGDPPSLLQWNNWAANLSLLQNSWPCQEVIGAQYGPTPPAEQLLLSAFTHADFTCDTYGKALFSWTAFPNAVIAIFCQLIAPEQYTIGCASNSTTLSGTTVLVWDVTTNKPAASYSGTANLSVFGW